MTSRTQVFELIIGAQLGKLMFSMPQFKLFPGWDRTTNS